ncbi:low molecular weight protein-tyrosine-phosphatase [Runella slithyformis]|uniref:Protein tyrosine phosphatase n=1 Tax=Runella slithyformis (strain ATCC 29530 / DSM 19594 / LMG 11500 / NCIMB 11436 / LSU 4) TaxID=761193 RepID=A0A7U4E7P5_RUNSL|nr:low molecular weight protein-tyrosine-phosphatase [Runella slithyformis]AEI50868.1 protein tyrosine phosphatase [Runella slithyformis DSM 19594]
MINVLFVCLGNICRSPLAEGVFRELVAQQGLTDTISCDSAGTHGYHIGALPDRRARRVAADYGIQLTHCARKLSSDDFANFDYIVAMDESNLEHIQTQSYRSTGFYPEEGRIFRFRDFDDEADGTDVPDPYYEDMAAFENVYQIVSRCGERFLEYLVKEHKLV